MYLKLKIFKDIDDIFKDNFINSVNAKDKIKSLMSNIIKFEFYHEYLLINSDSLLGVELINDLTTKDNQKIDKDFIFLNKVLVGIKLKKFNFTNNVERDVKELFLSTYQHYVEYFNIVNVPELEYAKYLKSMIK